jgi:hypothetical protein
MAGVALAAQQTNGVDHHKKGWLGMLIGVGVGVGIGALLVFTAPVSLPVAGGITLGSAVTAASVSALSVGAVYTCADAGSKAGDAYDREDAARAARLRQSQARYDHFRDESDAFEGSMGSGTPCSEIAKPGATLHIEGLPVAYAGVPVEEECKLRLGDPLSMRTGRRDILYGEGKWPVCTGESTTYHNAYAIPEQNTVFLGGREATAGSPPTEKGWSDTVYETLRSWVKTGQPAASFAADNVPLAGAANAIGANGLKAAAPGIARGLAAFWGAKEAWSLEGEALDPEGPNGPLASAFKDASGSLAAGSMAGVGRPPWSSGTSEWPLPKCLTCDQGKVPKATEALKILSFNPPRTDAGRAIQSAIERGSLDVRMVGYDTLPEGSGCFVAPREAGGMPTAYVVKEGIAGPLGLATAEDIYHEGQHYMQWVDAGSPTQAEFNDLYRNNWFWMETDAQTTAVSAARTGKITPALVEKVKRDFLTRYFRRIDTADPATPLARPPESYLTSPEIRLSDTTCSTCDPPKEAGPDEPTK